MSERLQRSQEKAASLKSPVKKYLDALDICYRIVYTLYW
jgi:hypothetical protein